MPLDPDLALRYGREFIGYGNPEAKWWFIGTEEGGGGSVEEIEARIAQWRDRGCPRALDLAQHCTAVRHGLDKWFRNDAKKQPPTQQAWRKLIRLMLTSRGEMRCGDPAHERLDKIRAFQVREWGSIGAGSTFLTEVSPLPARGARHWPYVCANWWKDGVVPDWAKSRSYSLAKCGEERRRCMREMFAASGRLHSARVVVVFANTQVVWTNGKAADWVRDVFEVDRSKEESIDQLFTIVPQERTIFCFTKHACAWGLGSYWGDLGSRLREYAIGAKMNIG